MINTYVIIKSVTVKNCKKISRHQLSSVLFLKHSVVYANMAISWHYYAIVHVSYGQQLQFQQRKTVVLHLSFFLFKTVSSAIMNAPSRTATSISMCQRK